MAYSLVSTPLAELTNELLKLSVFEVHVTVSMASSKLRQNIAHKYLQ